MSSIFTKFQERYEERLAEPMSLRDYLDLCAADPHAYATTAERGLAAIGEPQIVDTREDERLSRIFFNRKIRVWDTFNDFYGMEEVIEHIYAYFKHAAQNLEEAKQVLYLLGPVGGGKSSLAENLKKIFQRIPFYALKAEDEISPVFESPLGLFDRDNDWRELERDYKIPRRYLRTICSPWATRWLQEFHGDITKFQVVRLYPSVLDQICVSKVEPGDENTQDISSLVGKVNIRKLEDYDQSDPRAYDWKGGMNRTTQGVMEFVEMFKAPIKMLHPMLTATQEGHYNGTEQFGAIPYQGIILAHSNEAEWNTFRQNKNNEAFLDRVYIVKVPYCLRATEEEQIYRKLIANSELANAPCAPGTLRMMAEYSVLGRLKDPENSNTYSKMEVYDGKTLKDKDPKAKSLTDYKEDAGVDEGMDGPSTRFAYKILSKVFNYDTDQVAANPIHLMYILERQLQHEGLPPDVLERYVTFIKGTLAPKYADFIGDEIQKAYLESYHEYGQNLFERYILYADFWLQDKDYRDPDTGENFNRETLNEELEKIEKAAGIANPKDFRNETVGFVLRYRANHGGKSPDWTSYEKLREVIEKKMFSNTEELLPVVSFGKKASSEDEKKHEDFVARMMSKEYTRKDVRLVVEWYTRYRKHN